jgi:hypothetical protein
VKPGDLVKTRGTFGWGDFVLILKNDDMIGGRFFVLKTDGTTGWISHNFLESLV